MRIIYPATIAKWLIGLNPALQDRILNKIEFYAEQSNPLVFAKNIGKGLYRFRIGTYRVIFFIKNETMYIADIDRRDKIYR